MRFLLASVTALPLLVCGGPAFSQDSEADIRARETERQMTDDERFAMISSVIGALEILGVPRHPIIPEDVPMSAAYAPGVPRLGVPALLMSDASMGVTNPGYRPDDAGATAFPSSILVGATFDPALARKAGEAIAREARARGFNVMLAGGANLTSEVRNGRNYEYYSEDPWHTGLMASEAVNGIQSGGVISTLKHYAANNAETNRHWQNAVIDPAALRETDLLGFQIAIERSQPGAIMCGYNMVNGHYACGSEFLLNDVLKKEWGYKGWVMSDWGAVPSWEFALKGLDQESGRQIDVAQWGAEAFTDKLQAAHRDGALPEKRLSDMVRRILRSIYAVGVDKWEAPPSVDMAEHNQLALDIARQGIVLLKNEAALPLPTDVPLKVAAIGGYAQLGVPSGTGSGAVLPVGGYAGEVKIGGAHRNMGEARNLYLFAPSPLAELRRLLPKADIEFDGAYTPAESAFLARRSDVAIVFAVRSEGEAFDLADLSLPWGQDAVIEAVADANPNTIVVLETGNPVAMPWRNKVRAVVQAWFPGQAGATAIAEVLTGTVNPSGRTPITWPASLADTPRPHLPGLDTAWGTPTAIRFEEGAEVGYRWYAKTGVKPLYAFGHGLSYTSFAYSDLTVTGGVTPTAAAPGGGVVMAVAGASAPPAGEAKAELLSGGQTIAATFTVTNTGDREGADVPQLYLTAAPNEKRMRLLGFERVTLKPGESKQITLTVDPRLLARFDGKANKWRIAEGMHEIALGKSAGEVMLTARANLEGRLFGN